MILMKQMRNLKLLLLLLPTLLAAACDKRDSCELQQGYPAVITGPDYRKCSCCGGTWFLYLGEEVPENKETYYLADAFPDTGLVNSTTRYPLYVRIHWKQTENPPCGDTAHHITVTHIVAR